MTYRSTLTDYLPDFCEALQAQLEADAKRWGDTWKHRAPLGQEARAFARFDDYLDQWRNTGTPIPWLKIAGEALIAWVREQEATA